MRGALIFSLVLAVISVVFALANPQPMEVNLLFAEVEGSTALVLILTLVIGVIIGLLAAVPTLFRQRKRLKEYKKSPGAPVPSERKKGAGEPTSASTEKEPPRGTGSATPPPASPPSGKASPLGKEDPPER